MLQINCPWCGPRAETEFNCGGESIARPLNTDKLTDAEWGDYVFMRKNLKGWHWEQWLHTAGCRKVIAVKRHTFTHDIAGSWTLAEGKRIYLEEQA